MAGNIVGLHVFGPDTGPEPLSNLDNNFSPLAVALNTLNTFSNYYVDTGAADASVVTIGAAQAATLAAGLTIQIKIAATNLTTSPQFNFNGTGNKTIADISGVSLIPGQLQAGNIYTLIYAGAQWLCQNINNYSGLVGAPVQLVAVKAADTARVNTTTMTNDPDLVFAVPFAGTWRFELGVYASVIGSASVGLRANVNSTSVNTNFATSNVISVVQDSQATYSSAPRSSFIANSLNLTINHMTCTTNPNGGQWGMSVFGVFVSTAASNFGFSWAQTNLDATHACTVHAGSFLTLTLL